MKNSNEGKSSLSRTGRKKTRRKHKKRTNRWSFILGLVIILGLLSFLFRKELMVLGFNMFLAPSVEKTLKHSYVPLKEDGQQKVENQSPFSLLLLGTDQRKNENGLSDSIIYTVIRPKDNKALFISIPRDSYTEIIGAEKIKGARKNTKINAAHSYGGPQMAVDTVENLLNEPVNYYATINFNGLVEVVDAVGGVELPVTKLLENKNPLHEKLRVEPNKPIYSGKEALMYVRYREDSDFNRTERQRIFLKAMLERMRKLNNLANIPKIIEMAGENFKTNMQPEFVLALAQQAILEGSSPAITSHMLQGEGRNTDQWYYILDEDDVKHTHDVIEQWLDPEATESELAATFNVE